MNTKPIIVNCLIGDEEKQILLDPEYPGSSIYHIFIDKENHGMVQKLRSDWFVGFGENSMLTDFHRDAIIRALSNAEYLNN